jgi:hypothetical protein
MGNDLVNKHPQQIKVQHGLYLSIERYRINGQSPLGAALNRVKAALGEMFPNGPNGAARLLIKRMAYKIMRLEAFENWDMVTGEASPTAQQHYISLSNSLRNDLQTLANMAKQQSPESGDPDLREYLDTLKRAAKAQVIKVEKE